MALICSNSFASIAGYVGLVRAGAPLLLLHHGIKPAHLEAVLASFQPSHLYAPRGQAGRPLGAALEAQLASYALYRTPRSRQVKPHEGLALLLTTSGSTGSRRFVRISRQNLTENTRSIAASLDIQARDRAITTMPMSYTYGLSILNSHLSVGASVIATEASLVEPGFWRLLRDQRATTFGGVPFTYQILRRLRFEQMELPSIRYLTQAGGRLAPELVSEVAEGCARQGRELIVMYGQTEATARISLLHWSETRSRPSSIGRAIPGGRLWIEDEQGRSLDRPDAVGELVYAGANVCWGYADSCEDLARGDQNRGVLRTGDLARRDADGFFHVVGRKSRFLKLFGHRTNLDEVEALVSRAGLECACTGSDEQLRIFAPRASAQAVRTLVAEQLMLSPKAFQVIGIDQLPRTDSGKLDYPRLEASHA